MPPASSSPSTDVEPHGSTSLNTQTMPPVGRLPDDLEMVIWGVYPAGAWSLRGVGPGRADPSSCRTTRPDDPPPSRWPASSAGAVSRANPTTSTSIRRNLPFINTSEQIVIAISCASSRAPRTPGPDQTGLPCSCDEFNCHQYNQQLHPSQCWQRVHNAVLPICQTCVSTKDHGTATLS